jgi:hypothetical protein
LCGYKRAGKDEVYNALRLVHNQVARLAFGDPVKREVAAACGVSVEFIEEHKTVFRPMLQWWGTDFRRNPETGGRDDYWRNQICQEYLKLIYPVWSVQFGEPAERVGTVPSCICFTDCRFPNELELVRKLGGKLWRVVRAHNPPNLDDHASERALDGFAVDRILYSHQGTLADFHTRILKAYAEDFPV